VRSLAGLSLVAGHRRGHGALYDAVNAGRIDISRLRRALAGLALPRAADGRLMLAAGVCRWERARAGTSRGRVFGPVYGRGERGGGARPPLVDGGAGRGPPRPR